MKKRAEILIKGDVQEAGYRNRVRRIAWKLNVTGAVENLDTGDVRVIAEGEENVLKEFIREINIKNEIANVEDISSEFSGATGEFIGFKKVVKEDEIGDRLDTAVEYLKTIVKTVKEGDDKIIETVKEGNKELGEKLGGKIDSFHNDATPRFDYMGEKIDGLGGKIDGLGNGLGGKIDDFHRDMVDQFNLLDVKYGVIAEMIGKAVEGMEKNNKSTKELLIDAGINAEKTTEKILLQMQKQQENHNQIIEKLINAMIETKKIN